MGQERASTSAARVRLAVTRNIRQRLVLRGFDAGCKVTLCKTTAGAQVAAFYEGMERRSGSDNCGVLNDMNEIPSCLLVNTPGHISLTSPGRQM